MLDFIKIKDSDASASKAWWNSDLLPSPPSRNTWKHYNYFNFYISCTFAPSAYNLGATLVSKGLLWWQGIIVAVIGSFILTVILVFNSRAPSIYHIGFPTAARSPAGMYGSFFWIFIRASVAIVYFAVQTFFAGQLMSVTLLCIFGHKWANFKNHLPASAMITSKDLLAFFIFWIIQFPFMFIHPAKMRHIYTFKAISVTASLFGVFGYCVQQAGGTLGSPESLGKIRVHGSDLIWAELYAINSVLGALLPVLINTADISRYARSTKDTAWVQGGAILFSKVTILFLGCATTSASAVFLHKTYWNIWDLYNSLLAYRWTAGMRTGLFFASISMQVSVIAVNAGTNSLPVGADFSGILPRYVNIPRGQVFCALVCPLLVPWLMISSGSAFLTFLGSYSVMLCPMVSCMIYDYYFIRKGNFHIPSFFDGKKGGLYWYTWGINWRAIAAWCVGVGLTTHGIAGSLDPTSVNQASKNMFKIGFFLSFSSSMLTFAVLKYIWPVRRFPGDKELEYEELAASGGYLEGESVETITGVSSGVDSVETSETNSSVKKESYNVTEKTV